MSPERTKKGHRPQKATSTTSNSASPKWSPRAVRHLRTQLGLERQAERGEWGSGEEEVTVAPRLTKMLLQTEDPEATARALLRIARRHQAET